MYVPTVPPFFQRNTPSKTILSSCEFVLFAMMFSRLEDSLKCILFHVVTIGRCTQTLHNHSGGILCLVVSPQGSEVYTSSFDAAVLCWRVSDGRCVRKLSGHSGPVLAMVMSADGEMLFYGSSSQVCATYFLCTSFKHLQIAHVGMLLRLHWYDIS